MSREGYHIYVTKPTFQGAPSRVRIIAPETVQGQTVGLEVHHLIIT